MCCLFARVRKNFCENSKVNLSTHITKGTRSIFFALAKVRVFDQIQLVDNKGAVTLLTNYFLAALCPKIQNLFDVDQT